MDEKYQNIIQEVSPLYDNLFISYQKSYHYDKKFISTSFSFEEEDNLIICPLTVETSNLSKELCFYGNPFEVISKKELSKNNLANVLKKLKEIEKKNNINKINFKFEIHESDIESYFDKYSLSIAEIYRESQINLEHSLEKIKNDFSKGHKSCLKIIYPEILYKLIDHKNYKDKQIKEMQDLHFTVSNNKTRSDETWMKMEKMILEKKGFMIKVLNKNKLIGYSFFFHNHSSVYYFSSCVLRDNFKSYKNIGHTMILNAINYSKELDLKYFILGRCKTLFNSENKNDIKISNVEKFKSSFGGQKKCFVIFKDIPFNLHI